MQTAALAEAAGERPGLIAAALLHDIGHMIHHLGENPAAQGIDDWHEARAAKLLAEWFEDEVTEPVRLHVAAKRFLCATEPAYAEGLAADSALSLAVQGGAMTPEEIADFRGKRWAPEAIRLRRYDDGAKVPGLATPPLDHFLGYVEQCLRRVPARVPARP